MRRLRPLQLAATVTVTAALAPALVLLPTVPPARAAAPVAPHLRALPVAGVDPSALRASRVLPGGRALPHTLADALAPERRPAVLTAPLAPAATGTGRFDLVASAGSDRSRAPPCRSASARAARGPAGNPWTSATTAPTPAPRAPGVPTRRRPRRC